MADTEYHTSAPLVQTETKQWRSGESEIAEEESPDWDYFDRCLILMSLCISERILRRSNTRMDLETKVEIQKRLKQLIQEYRNGDR